MWSKVLNEILCLKDNETLLVVVDDFYREMGLDILNVHSSAKLLVMKTLTSNGEEPLEFVAQELLNCDAAILLTQFSLSHTNARRTATKNGARIISMPGFTYDMKNCVDIDYLELKELHTWLRPLVVDAKVNVIGKGTDVSFKVCNTHGYPEEIIMDKKGAFDNLPKGEIDSGVLDINGVITFVNDIKVEILNGVGKIVSSNAASLELKSKLDKHGPSSFKIAEFGIGTNPKARITGNTLEDEKVLGTVHFAFGNDLTYGGINSVDVHIDCVVESPTVYLDGKKVLSEGKLYK